MKLRQLHQTITWTSRGSTPLISYYHNPIYDQGEALSILFRYWAVEGLTEEQDTMRSHFFLWLFYTESSNLKISKYEKAYFIVLICYRMCDYARSNTYEIYGHSFGWYRRIIFTEAQG